MTVAHDEQRDEEADDPVILRRPPCIDGIEIPTVRNLDEVILCHASFGSVLTAGPEAWEVELGHDNHQVWEFPDTTVAFLGPTLEQVEEMITWGCDQPDLLVHCHAGMSRSTAVAWGVAMARGLDPQRSIAALQAAHPPEISGEPRLFIPNLLIVEHLGVLLGHSDLVPICRQATGRWR